MLALRMDKAIFRVGALMGLKLVLRLLSFSSVGHLKISENYERDKTPLPLEYLFINKSTFNNFSPVVNKYIS